MVKKIAVYGSFVTKVPVKQRYWITRVDGVKQRYWKIKRGSFKTVKDKGRYEFSGTGHDLYRAVITSHRIVPKGYVDVPAEKFLQDPEKYGSEGYWIDRDVES
jgi:hypothetical protein